MSENQNATKDLMTSHWVETINKTGRTPPFNNMIKQIKQSDYYDERLRFEKANWEGYTEPEIRIDIYKYIDEVKKMGKDETIVFEIHHPYYRKKIREVAAELGYKCKSSVDNTIKSIYDSEILVHFACKKATPKSKVKWKCDYGWMGGLMGKEAICEHCGIWFHTDYLYPHETKEKEWHGYMEIQGKNTITVKS